MVIERFFDSAYFFTYAEVAWETRQFTVYMKI